MCGNLSGYMCPTRRKARGSRDLAQMIEQLSDWRTISATYWTSWADQPAKSASCADCGTTDFLVVTQLHFFQPHSRLSAHHVDVYSRKTGQLPRHHPRSQPRNRPNLDHTDPPSAAYFTSSPHHCLEHGLADDPDRMACGLHFLSFTVLAASGVPA